MICCGGTPYCAADSEEKSRAEILSGETSSREKLEIVVRCFHQERLHLQALVAGHPGPATGTADICCIFMELGIQT
jgi:hypothetical protein